MKLGLYALGLARFINDLSSCFVVSMALVQAAKNYKSTNHFAESKFDGADY